MDTKLEVPYASQYLDVKDREQHLIACGMTCVYMALKFFDKNGDDLDTLVEKGMNDGGYTKSGWLHDYLLQVFKDHGAQAYREENMRDRDVEKIAQAIKVGNPVIVSAERRLFDQRQFHMVLITGIREADGQLEGFFYHDPASLRREKAHLYVPLQTFLLDWRRKAIYPSRG